MRNFLNSHDFGNVEYSTIKSENEIEDWDTFPCIVKPVDSQGQRGVQLIRSKDYLGDAVKIALKSSEKGLAIVEEYLDGIEISCNVLMQNGICLFDVLSERLVHGGKLIGIPKGHLVPCINVSLENIDNSLKLVHKIIEGLGIKNGCLYFQMKVTSKGIRVIEIAPRLDGCHMWRLIKHATGHNYLANTIDTLIEKSSNIVLRPAVEQGDFYELIFQQAPLNSSFYKSEHPVPVDALYHEYRYLDGDRINPVNGKLENVGYYVRKLSPKDLQVHKISNE
jgi:carbamoylphosphate synthase large subunit